MARVPSTVREMMTKKVITTEPDQPIIEAAKLKNTVFIAEPKSLAMQHFV